MKHYVAALALAGASFGGVAAEQAQSPEECGIAADMAIVARSLAHEAIQRPKADTIMQRIYDVKESERGQALMNDILEAAYKDDPSRPSQTFAEELFKTCMTTGGNMDPVLGKRL